MPRLAHRLCAVLLVSALPLLTACASTPDKPPACHGAYTPINTPDHYRTSEKPS